MAWRDRGRPAVEGHDPSYDEQRQGSDIEEVTNQQDSESGEGQDRESDEQESPKAKRSQRQQHSRGGDRQKQDTRRRDGRSQAGPAAPTVRQLRQASGKWPLILPATGQRQFGGVPREQQAVAAFASVLEWSIGQPWPRSVARPQGPKGEHHGRRYRPSCSGGRPSRNAGTRSAEQSPRRSDICPSDARCLSASG